MHWLMNSLRDMPIFAALLSISASISEDIRMEITSFSGFFGIKFAMLVDLLLLNCILSDIMNLYSKIDIKIRIHNRECVMPNVKYGCSRNEQESNFSFDPKRVPVAMKMYQTQPCDLPCQIQCRMRLRVSIVLVLLLVYIFLLFAIWNLSTVLTGLDASFYYDRQCDICGRRAVFMNGGTEYCERHFLCLQSNALPHKMGHIYPLCRLHEGLPVRKSTDRYNTQNAMTAGKPSWHSIF